MLNIEKRRSQRVNLKAPIQVMFPNGPSYSSYSYDFSESGLYLQIDKDKLSDFQPGTLIRVQFQGLNYTPPVMTAKVVRTDSTGVGVMLIETFQEGSLDSLEDQAQKVS